jgi:hypothetical protein
MREDGAQFKSQIGTWSWLLVVSSKFLGVKSLDPIRNAVHLKSDVKLRVSSCPRQELM